MNFKNAVAACLAQYTTLEGRASRAEFWYFVLFVLIVNLAVLIVSFFVPPNFGPVFQAMAMLVFAIPLFSAFVRRLHDIGAATWRIAFLFVPILQFVCIYWAARPGQEGENKFGEAPVD